MSGIYISGISMPGLIHGPITIRIYPTGKCINMGSLWPRDAMPGVTAIPVPEHGDLIDRNMLSKRIKEETINQAEFYADRRHPVVLAYGDCYGKVQNAPTIIPADKET